MRKFITAAIVAAATIGFTFGASAQQKTAAPAAAPTKVTVYKSPT